MELKKLKSLAKRCKVPPIVINSDVPDDIIMFIEATLEHYKNYGFPVDNLEEELKNIKEEI